MKNGKHMSLHEATDKIMAILEGEERGRRPARDSEDSQHQPSGRGVGRWLAEALGIPANLAVAGGERAYAAMLALQHARDAGDGSIRQQSLVQAQRHMAKLDPARHGRLVQHLQGCVVALGGRRGDTEIAHVTPGEWVIPERMLSPEMRANLIAAARAEGIDPATFRVASGRNSINPHTGQMEFAEQLPMPGQGGTKSCTFPASFSAVGPSQARGQGAFGIEPPNNSVAINPSIFGFPYDTIAEREAAQKAIKAQIPSIQVSAPGLEGHYPGSTTFTVGDVGDRNIRNSPDARFDIYRFESQDDALKFGKRRGVQTTVSGVPNSWACPKP